MDFWRCLELSNPIIVEFKSHFHPHRCLNGVGFWCFFSYPNSDNVFLYGEPNYLDMTWKPYHFLIRGNWKLRN